MRRQIHQPDEEIYILLLVFWRWHYAHRTNAHTRQACQRTGLWHGWPRPFSISVGSKEAVDELTERLRNDGYAILSNPRTTGDGYYESTVADPEGNCIEISE